MVVVPPEVKSEGTLRVMVAEARGTRTRRLKRITNVSLTFQTIREEVPETVRECGNHAGLVRIKSSKACEEEDSGYG